ncbi:hypothetical protein K9N68_25630 [Kovacikia minuta CCNUW1]|uniref:hypothetical protein n=1 Tax=Kovacikia minuta TaxID=2931930 RepID=UPI001CCC6E6A|nr:hypothetical protein [Kovacikia minuta]UBF24992.1 hypothetical protein K9N68_25630 [Kovacikia minuta CCNUW1]
MGRGWVKDPHSGGVKIPEAVRQRIEQRIKTYANAHYAGKFNRIEVRFRGALCYVDAYLEPPEPSAGLLKITGETREQYFERQRNYSTHLCRLRYFGNEESWSLAFYTYSNERYEPSMFHNGTFYGKPEEAFDVGAVYLDH